MCWLYYAHSVQGLEKDQTERRQVSVIKPGIDCPGILTVFHIRNLLFKTHRAHVKHVFILTFVLIKPCSLSVVTKRPKCMFLPSTQRSASGGKKTQKTTRDDSDSDSDSDEDYSPDPDEDDEDEHAEEHPPPPATASWSSDHNYIAVTPEKTTPISPTVLNKKCMYLFEGLKLLSKPHCCFSMINVVPVLLTQFRYDQYIWGRT